MISQRDYSIDTLRVIATILVVFIHLSARHVVHGIESGDFNFSFHLANIVDSISRVSVPIFVMISGKYLLGTSDYLKKEGFYKNKLYKIGYPLFFWTFIYLMIKLFAKYFIFGKFEFLDLLKDTLLGNPYYHLWYLFMIIGLYLITPILNTCLSNIKDKAILKLSISFIFLGFIIDLYDFVLENKPIFLLWFIKYLGYYLFGFYFSKKKLFNLRILIFLFTISSLSTALLSVYTALNFKSVYFYSYLSPFVIISSISLYAFFIHVEFRRNLLSDLSGMTFGIYLVHPLLIEFYNRLIRSVLVDIFSIKLVLIDLTIGFLIVFVGSTLFVFLMRKNNFLKKFI